MTAFTADNSRLLVALAQSADPETARELRAIAMRIDIAIRRGSPARAPLTRRQAQVYRWVYQFRAREGYAPSHDEIAAHFQFSSIATVNEHLSNLERKGYITREFNNARAITCIVHIDELASIPSAPKVGVRP